MKILIINPPRVNGYSVAREERFEHTETDSVYPPLSHLYTAAYLEENGFDVRVIDANGFNLTIKELKDQILYLKPDVIYSRTGFDTHMKDLNVLKLAKKYGIKTITRNRIISEVPEIREEILRTGCIDFFVNNDPEQIVLEICEKIRDNKKTDNIKGTSINNKGKIRNNPPVDKIINFDDLPMPAYHLLPNIKPYFSGILLPKPFVIIQTSNGCPFNCTFCAYNKSEYKARTPLKVVEELEQLKNKFKIKSFLVFDDMFTLYKDRAKEICKEMIKRNLGLKWTCCTRINSVDDELILLMKQAGCIEVAFGIESGSEEILKTTKKGISKKMIMNTLKICEKYKMKFYNMMILGLPGETEQTFKETMQLVKQINPFYTQFGLAVPFPNTDIYKYYDKEGLLLTKDWTKYNTLQREPLIKTKTLTPQRLKQMKKEAYKQTSLSTKNIIKNIIISLKEKRNIESNIRAFNLLVSKIFKKGLMR